MNLVFYKYSQSISYCIEITDIGLVQKPKLLLLIKLCHIWQCFTVAGEVHIYKVFVGSCLHTSHLIFNIMTINQHFQHLHMPFSQWTLVIAGFTITKQHHERSIPQPNLCIVQNNIFKLIWHYDKNTTRELKKNNTET